MSATFDFQALVARAQQDQPDAVLLDQIHALNHACRRDAGTTGYAHRNALREQIAAHQPATLPGLVAKLRLAESIMHKAPLFALQAAALRDAIEWLDGQRPARVARRARGQA